MLGGSLASGAQLACSLCKVLEEHKSCQNASWKFSLTRREAGLQQARTPCCALVCVPFHPWLAVQEREV